MENIKTNLSVGMFIFLIIMACSMALASKYGFEYINIYVNSLEPNTFDYYAHFLIKIILFLLNTLPLLVGWYCIFVFCTIAFDNKLLVLNSKKSFTITSDDTETSKKYE